MAKIAVCLSGCGFKDGAEIHEAVITLLALDRAGADILCCAPDIEQTSVVDHLTDQTTAGEKRSVLIESARIARGNIVELSEIRAVQIDGLIFPGGMGAAQNLCTFVSDGSDCKVNTHIENLIGQMIAERKPIGAICIAPAMLARVLGKLNINPRMTIGNDKQTAQAMEKMGAKHVDCPASACVVDEHHRIVTTPAYMLAKGPAEIFEGIRKLVDEVLRLAKA
ncbi:MAG: isoprenoid biosynthesis glyoxalase ElbB [Planctomycetota bacterium]|jgi:enhancing lycopene biosynthesis protein 2